MNAFAQRLLPRSVIAKRSIARAVEIVAAKQACDAQALYPAITISASRPAGDFEPSPGDRRRA